MAGVVAGRRADRDADGGSGRKSEITVVTLATGEARVLPGLRLTGMNYPFDVSTDGKWLVTTNEVDESDEIWLLEAGK